MTTLKDEILARDGKIVIRPDSGNPADILCGLPFTMDIDFDYSDVADGDYNYGNHIVRVKSNFGIPHPQHKGVIELLWDVFGGTINGQGFKVLDSHIGAIYGDSITLDRAKEINERLAAKGFASTNWVAGVGSYSMGYATRDNQGSAVKATYCELTRRGTNPATGKEIVVTEGREIFKDPITDDGTKKSAKGLLKVFRDENNVVTLQDQVTWEEEATGLLTPVFKDGKFLKEVTLTEIRERIANQL